MVVKEELQKLGLHFIIPDMGVVDIMEDITNTQREQIRLALAQSGLELMDDKKALLVEDIKSAIIEMVRCTVELPRKNLSDYLSEKLNYNYTSMASIFMEVQGMTIEKFIIAHKIERVKELITYDELSLTEIAWRMYYSSVGHLSNQFKKITGLTPSHFKKLNIEKHNLIEEGGDNSKILIIE